MKCASWAKVSEVQMERALGWGGIGTTGLVKLCLFVHVSSSKPNAAAEFDLEGA